MIDKNPFIIAGASIMNAANFIGMLKKMFYKNV